MAHPTDSSPLFLCPFCHNLSLQHYRLLNVTTNVTRPNYGRVRVRKNRRCTITVCPTRARSDALGATTGRAAVHAVAGVGGTVAVLGDLFRGEEGPDLSAALGLVVGVVAARCEYGQ